MSDNIAAVNEYIIENLDCADCAVKFQAKLEKIPGVEWARVNFLTSRLKIRGNVDLGEIQRIADLEEIKVIPKEKWISAGKSALRQWVFWATVVSGILLAIAWIYAYFSGVASQGLYALVIVVGGYSTFKKGFKNLFKLNFDMSVLMTVAVTGAILIGEWMEGATVAWLFSLSELLEGYTADKARKSLETLMEMAPTVATVIRGDHEEKISIDLVEIDDNVLVRPGEEIPVDGVVLSGNSGVNQAPITGESMPVTKSPGAEVFAGTINETGALTIRVTKTSNDTTLAKIISMVEDAQNNKTNAQRFIDRFARYYTPAVMVLAALFAVIPPLLGDLDWYEWIYRGLALLVVACPCALVITTPVVVVSAIGNAARNGVLIKGGIHLERLGAVKAVALDKTGTLTKGKPRVNRVVPFEGTEEEVLALAAGLEKFSEHHLAGAIMQEVERRKLSFLPSENFEAIPGKGAQGLVGGAAVKVGNRALFEAELTPPILSEIQRLEDRGNTVIMIGKGDKVVGLVALADQVRNSAYSLVPELKKLGITRVVMLTGDSQGVAKTVARQVQVDEVRDSLLPAEKVEFIRKMKAENGMVMMVGDGINDAPALALADVAVAMGVAGTDTALETADVALMADDLTKLPFALELGRQSMKVIRQNIAFALGLKLLALVAVFPGWLTLWLAILADMGANILVTLNGIRLVRYKRAEVRIEPEKTPTPDPCGGV